MDSENQHPNSIAERYDIDALFEAVTNEQHAPHEVFHQMLQAFTHDLPKQEDPAALIREVMLFSRRITDTFIENEFEISYA